MGAAERYFLPREGSRAARASGKLMAISLPFLPVQLWRDYEAGGLRLQKGMSAVMQGQHVVRR